MDKEEFNYTYSAPSVKERMELESIKKEYEPKTENESKIEKIRRLDRIVKECPTVIALSMGIIGTLIFGIGITFFLEWNSVLFGIVFSVIGVAIMLPASLVYRKISDKLKKKYGPEILKLSEEILNESEK